MALAAAPPGRPAERVDSARQAPRPGMAPEAMGVLAGVLDGFTEILGDGPSYATFHFASRREGARLAARDAPSDVAATLRRADLILGHRSRLLEAGADALRVEVDGSPLLHRPGQTGRAVLLGLLEGMLGTVCGRPLAGAVESVSPDGHKDVLRFVRREDP